MCYQGLHEISLRPEKWAHFAVIFLALLMVSLLFLEPFLHWVRGLFNGDRHDDLQRPLPLLSGILLGLLLDELFHEVAVPAPVSTERNMLSSVVLVAGLTFAWISTARSEYRRAWLWGLGYGIFVAILKVILLWTVHDGRLFSSSANALQPYAFGSMIRIAISQGLLYWGPLGAAGGWVMRLSRRWYPGLLTGLSIIIIGFVLDVALVNWWPDFITNLFWMVALALRSDTLQLQS